MEKPQLTSDHFWQTESSHILWNTRTEHYDKELVSWMREQTQLKNHLLFSTSGTTGSPKWVALSKSAILACAGAVVEHLNIKDGATWFQALPVFHVGGFALYARAYVTDGTVVEMQGNWQALSFVEQLTKSKAGWTSLVPTQLVDIVEKELYAPPALRGVIVGGGSIRHDVLKKALELGWPVLESYGMSEAGTQIATAVEQGGAMKILSHMKVKTANCDCLQWKSDFGFSGYVESTESGDYTFTPAQEWVCTSDRVLLENDTLGFLSRADRNTKILGELIDIDALEQEVNALADQEVVLAISPDLRRGSLLIPVVEHQPSDFLKQHLSEYSGIEKLEAIEVMPFPRTQLGKIKKFCIQPKENMIAS